MWHLHNENYHQMVSVLIQVVRTISPLRIEAPEWHPKVVDGDVEEDKGKCKKLNNETAWNTVTRGPSNDNIRKHGNDNERKSNYYEVLSSEEDEEVLSDDTAYDKLEDDIDDESYNEEKNKITVLALPTREILLHKLRKKENLLDEKDEEIYSMTRETK